LTVSGLPSDSFFFAGFLPTKSTARRRRLNELACIDATLIFYESPSRLLALIEDIADMLGERSVTVVRELTKRFETHYRGTATTLVTQLDGQDLKGEVVLLVGPPTQAEVSDALIMQQVEEAMQTMSPRDAVRAVADVLNVQRKRVYDLMVAQRKG